MTTTCDFLDAIKARHGLPSDYALAAKIGITRSSVSRLRNHKDTLGDSTAIKVAELLEIDAGYVAACAHAERAKRADEKALWQSIMQKLGSAAALVLIGIGGLSAPSPAQADEHQRNDGIGIMSNRRRNRRQHKIDSFAAVFSARHPFGLSSHSPLAPI